MYTLSTLNRRCLFQSFTLSLAWLARALQSVQGSIVTWGAPVNKQMGLVPGSAVNSTHA